MVLSRGKKFGLFALYQQGLTRKGRALPPRHHWERYSGTQTRTGFWRSVGLSWRMDMPTWQMQFGQGTNICYISFIIIRHHLSELSLRNFLRKKKNFICLYVIIDSKISIYLGQQIIQGMILTLLLFLLLVYK